MVMKGLLVPRRTRRSAVSALRNLPAFDDVFDEIFHGFGVAPAWPEASRLGEFTPRIDVRETDEEVIVQSRIRIFPSPSSCCSARAAIATLLKMQKPMA